MQKVEDINYEKFEDTNLEDNEIKQITFENLRKKMQHIKLLLTRIKENDQIVNNAPENFIDNNSSNISDETSENEFYDIVQNQVVFSNNVGMENSIIPPGYCKRKGKIFVFFFKSTRL